MMKNWIRGMLFSALLTGMTMSASAGDIHILYTNDVHCSIDTDEEKGVLGYAKIAAVKQDLEAAGEDVILVDSGDAIQGGVVGTLSDGEYIIDIMNDLGYEVAIPGNHEFDYGMEQALFLMKEKAQYDYVCTNITDIATGESILPPYVIREIGGKKIAFVGVVTPKTRTSSSPANFKNEDGEVAYDFCQKDLALYSVLQDAVDKAREEGADYVILLAHLGIEDACSPWMSTEVIENTSGIDVVLDGHSHSILEEELVTNKDGKKVILSSTGTRLAAVGELTIAEDGAMHTGLIREYDHADPEAEAYISEIEEAYDAVLSEVVASTDFPLVVYDPATSGSKEPVRIIRNAETNLGDLVSDAYRYATGADIAFANGGGIRVDIPAGDITYGDIISVHPFGNEICLKKVSGQQILDALEMGVSELPAESGEFLHVSGLTYEIDMNVESAVERDENGCFMGVNGPYRVQNVYVGEEPLDLKKTYTLAANDFLLKNGGGGLTMFLEDELLLDSVIIDNRALINYIVETMNGVVSDEYADPYGQGRIVAIE